MKYVGENPSQTALTTTNMKWHRSCWKRDVQLFLYAGNVFPSNYLHMNTFACIRCSGGTFFHLDCKHSNKKTETDSGIEFSAMFRRRDQKPCDSKLFTFPSLISTAPSFHLSLSLLFARRVRKSSAKTKMKIKQKFSSVLIYFITLHIEYTKYTNTLEQFFL